MVNSSVSLLDMKALPDPDFRYFSKIEGSVFIKKSAIEDQFTGNRCSVAGAQQLACRPNLSLRFSVKPV